MGLMIAEQPLKHRRYIAGGNGGTRYGIGINAVNLRSVSAPGINFLLGCVNKTLHKVLVHILLRILGDVMIGIAVAPKPHVVAEGDGAYCGILGGVLIVQKLHVAHGVIVCAGVTAGAGGKGHLIRRKGGVCLLKENYRGKFLLSSTRGKMGKGEFGVIRSSILRIGIAAAAEDKNKQYWNYDSDFLHFTFRADG